MTHILARNLVNRLSAWLKIIILSYILFWPNLGLANFTLALDDEIEQALKNLAMPLLQSAHLPIDQVRIFVILDNTPNAFVLAGKNIYIHSGLLTKFATDPEAILGVLAHEIGHIKAGHVARNSEKLDKVNTATIASILVGATAAILTQDPRGLIATTSLASHSAERELMRYSRENEESADQAAINLLAASHLSASGLVRVLEQFKRHELHAGPTNPYILTHPLSRERLIFIKEYLARHTPGAMPINSQANQAFIRAMVKLKAYIDPPSKTLKSCQAQTDNCLYAKSISYYKIPDLTNSFKQLDQLIQRHPKDPYFYELKGQILYENGQIKQAIKYYQKSHQLSPLSPLILLGLATAEVEFATNNDGNLSLLKNAISHLKQSLQLLPENPQAYRELSIAYGHLGELALANLALADAAMVQGDQENARKFAQIAKQKLPRNSPYHLHISDILEATNQIDK